MSEVLERDEQAEQVLPSGWETAKLHQLIGTGGEFCDGDWVESKDQDENGEVRLIQLADVGVGNFRSRSARFLTPEKAKALKCTFLQPSDLLIARMPDPLGRACLFPGDKNQSVTVVDVCIVRTGQGEAFQKWLMHVINSPDIQGEISGLQSGSTRLRISRGNLATISLPIPPLHEQERIVTKLEELFTRLDAGIALTKRTKALLKRYRQSVLKAAVEGELSREWREAQGDTLEDAEALLERILDERREKWRSSERRGKYEEPEAPDVEGLPELPKGWTWATTSQLFEFVTSGSRGWAQYYSDDGALFLRMGNLNHDDIRLDLRDIQRVNPPPGAEGSRTRVEPRDILVSITADVGMVAEIPCLFSEEAYINQHVALCRPTAQTAPSFVAWYLTSLPGQQQMTKLQRGATKVGLGLDDIRNVAVSLPSLAEQEFIVSEVERRLSVIDEMEASLSAELKRAESLRRSILHRAFTGRLVPQEPSDEPASVLLECIQAERIKAGAAIIRGRGKKDKTEGEEGAKIPAKRGRKAKSEQERLIP